MPASVGHNPHKPPFFAGEPQLEALARLEYLQQRGGGWCEIAGPRGIGKTSLLKELAERAQTRGEKCAWLDLGPLTSFDWFGLLADACQFELPANCSTLEARRRFEDHIAGWKAMNRTAWLFVDDAEDFQDDLSRGCRWLVQLARRVELSLMVVVSNRVDGEELIPQDDADLQVELWPWESTDCERYIEACGPMRGRGVTFTSGAIGVLSERSAGLPRDLAKLTEWCLAAAEAEAVAEIEADLVHAVIEEFAPKASTYPRYESSAAYGAW